MRCSFILLPLCLILLVGCGQPSVSSAPTPEPDPTPTPTSGQLSLSYVPAEAAVLVQQLFDSGRGAATAPTRETVGETRVSIYDLKAGRYAVSVSAEGYAPHSFETQVLAGSSLTERVQLRALNQPPVPAFEVLATDTPLELSLDAAASQDADGTVESHSWDFGDGQVGKGVRVRHRYAEPGTYTVSLSVTDDAGASATVSQTLKATRTEVTPVYNATFTLSAETGVAPLEVSFTAPVQTEQTLRYRWSFGNGDTAEGVGEAGRTAAHVYTEGGTFTAQLSLMDGEEVVAQSVRTLTVTDPPPVAAFTLSPTSGYAPLTVALNAAGSYDPNGDLKTYRWTLTSGTGASAGRSLGEPLVLRGAAPSYTFEEPGSYEVRLQVTDAAGLSSEHAQTVTVLNRGPEAAFSSEQDRLSLSVDAGASRDPEGGTLSYAWDFGDGTKGEGKGAEHRYRAPGRYSVSLTVTDSYGAAATSAQQVVVTDAYALAPISVSPDGRTLRAGDEPFFWLGDTAWLLFSATEREDVLFYLDDAQAKGFTVVQVFLTAVWSGNGDSGENKYGDAPFVDNDPSRLGSAYFDYVEWVIDEAAKRGLYVAIMNGEPGRLGDTRVPYKLTNNAEAYSYGNALGRRLRRQTLANNIVWLSGQDRSGNKDLGPDGWRATSEGVADGVNGVTRFDNSADYSTTFMSHHPDGCCSSSQWFHDDAFLDFNGVNTWKNYHLIVPKISGDHARATLKPTVCLEQAYERLHRDGELRTDWHVRFQGYWCTLSGGSGYAYGHVTGYRMTRSNVWPQFLSSEGREDMIHLKTLLTSKPLENRVPDQSLLTSDPGRYDIAKTYTVAARAAAGSYAFIYTPQGQSFTLDLSKLSKTALRARWFDPRNGRYHSAGTHARGSVTFDAPGEVGEGNDWVLVVD